MNEKAPMALILKAAKQLIRNRCKNAGTWAYYANPAMCLFGPHGGISYWSDSFGLEKVCTQFNLKFVRYCNAADSGRVLAAAKEISSRYARFCNSVNQWRRVRTENFADNSTEAVEVNRFGTERRVTLVAPNGDRCF